MANERAFTRQQDACRRIVDSGGVTRRHASVGTKGGLELRKLFQSRIGSGVLVVYDLAASGRDRDDFTPEGIARSRRALLADEGEAILFRAVDFQEVGEAFGGLPHSDAEHGISEAVDRDRVDQGAVTQFAAEAEVGGVMRGAAHHLDAAG